MRTTASRLGLCARWLAIAGIRCAPALAFSAACGAPPAPALELPFSARLEPVIEQGEIEGQPVRVVRFRTSLPPDEVLHTVRRAWRGVGAGPLVEARSGHWRLVSAHDPAGFRTLQLRPAPEGGSEGVLSVWPSGTGLSAASSRAERPDLSRLLPADARVVRRFASTDGGRRSETLVAVAHGTPSWIASAIGGRLSTRGFVLDPLIRGRGASRGAATADGVADVAVGEGASSGSAWNDSASGRTSLGEAASYRMGGHELTFTVSAIGDGRSGIVLHLTGVAR